MTTCHEVRDWLLEAEPAELRGQGEGELAAHVRGCSTCAALAARILADEAALATAVSAMVAKVALDVEPSRTRHQAERRRRTRRRVVWGVAAPLAAAAIGALALFPRVAPGDPGSPLGTMPEWALPGGAGPGGVIRDGGGRAAILPTANPDITVVWLLK